MQRYLKSIGLSLLLFVCFPTAGHAVTFLITNDFQEAFPGYEPVRAEDLTLDFNPGSIPVVIATSIIPLNQQTPATNAEVITALTDDSISPNGSVVALFTPPDAGRIVLDTSSYESILLIHQSTDFTETIQVSGGLLADGTHLPLENNTFDDTRVFDDTIGTEQFTRIIDSSNASLIPGFTWGGLLSIGFEFAPTSPFFGLGSAGIQLGGILSDPPTGVPEPGTLALLGFGLLGAARAKKRASA